MDSNGYEAEVDSIKKKEWSELLQQFEDASVYQTWSYGTVRWGEENLSHLVIKRHGEVAAVAQARILKFPVVGGIAYVRWGPLWRLKGQKEDLDSLQQVARILAKEYALRRGLLLRLLPNEVVGRNDAIRSIFEKEGYRWRQSAYRTILLDLAPSLESLRKNLQKDWRYSLHRAEKRGMRIQEGTSDELFATFTTLYDRMVIRKKFVPGVDVREFRAIQRDLSDASKMRIFICENEGEPVGAVVGSLLGNTGIYILGATAEKGLKLQCSYLLQWKMIEWFRENGARYYDLNGFDPEGYPGTSFFKSGFSGKDVRHLGEFDACHNPMASFSVKSGDLLRSFSFKTKHLLNGFRSVLLRP